MIDDYLILQMDASADPLTEVEISSFETGIRLPADLISYDNQDDTLFGTIRLEATDESLIGLHYFTVSVTIGSQMQEENRYSLELDFSVQVVSDSQEDNEDDTVALQLWAKLEPLKFSEEIPSYWSLELGEDWSYSLPDVEKRKIVP